MKHFILSAVVLLTPVMAASQSATPVIDDILTGHILPRFEVLAERSQTLAETAAGDCTPSSDTLRGAYGDAFDVWIAASHLRFGPTEVADRAFALSFWPDSRGATPRALNTLIAEADPIAASPEDYAAVSIAARGFYAMEFLLFDDTLMRAGDTQYHCQLVQTISADIAALSSDILSDWQNGYAEKMRNPTSGGLYRSEEEVLQEAFKALTTGLQFTSDARLGRPLGTFDRPRPNRAEARRSARSARHVTVSLTSLRDLAQRLATSDASLSATLTKDFDRALTRLAALDDPVFAGVADPQGRVRIEVIQQSVDVIRATVRADLGPTLGVAAGFNALDGD
ncbi:imelysin family protein [uncultured Roseobacter sp.]|uniref:imelysin family protein n=1 Tax=uncultured Roseobacter sp. TaxID=114847 RepID=UPI00260E21A3|nr:imelysin family protein [uncultured Roseobacter sp.]